MIKKSSNSLLFTCFESLMRQTPRAPNPTKHLCPLYVRVSRAGSRKTTTWTEVIKLSKTWCQQETGDFAESFEQSFPQNFQQEMPMGYPAPALVAGPTIKWSHWRSLFIFKWDCAKHAHRDLGESRTYTALSFRGRDSSFKRNEVTHC